MFTIPLRILIKGHSSLPKWLYHLLEAQIQSAALSVSVAIFETLIARGLLAFRSKRTIRHNQILYGGSAALVETAGLSCLFFG